MRSAEPALRIDSQSSGFRGVVGLENKMKVWIICDNNNEDETIIPFSSLELAQKYQEQYSGLAGEDCWLFNEEGTEVKE